jgi:hypothetical protein
LSTFYFFFQYVKERIIVLTLVMTTLSAFAKATADDGGEYRNRTVLISPCANLLKI